MAKFTLYKGADNQYRWRLIAANGNIICWAEGYIYY